MLNKLLILISIFYTTCSFAQDILPKNTDSDYFPIGVWLQSPSTAEVYKKAGINMFVGVYAEGLTQGKLDIFKKNGMKVICDQNEFGLKNLNEPAIYAWMQEDEPDNAQWNSSTQRYDPCIDPAIIIHKYNKMKENDPSRPVYLNLGKGVSATNWIGRGKCTGRTDMYIESINGYLKGCDIASYDIYPVNSTEPSIKDSLWYVAKGIDNLLQWSNHSKPVWCWIETSRIDEKPGRKPTPAEVKSQVWMALIHGASGFGYFCHSFYPSFVEAAFLRDPVMLKAITEINSQVTELAPVLNSPNSSDYATVSVDRTSIPIHISTKHYQGEDYILAVAMRPGQTNATFTIAKGKTVEVLGESRSIQIENGKFSDSFSDYAVHLYKISETSTAVIETKIENKVNVFPNPAKDFVTVTFSEALQTNASYSFYNMNGQLLKTGILYSNHSKLALPTNYTGPLMLHLNADNQIFIEKGPLMLHLNADNQIFIEKIMINK